MDDWLIRNSWSMGRYSYGEGFLDELVNCDRKYVMCLTSVDAINDFLALYCEL
jgi:hypothetical protein